MNTSNDFAQSNGARQVPLTDAAQLVAGCLITGMGFDHIWKVIGHCPDRPGWVDIEKWKCVPPPPHIHTFTPQRAAGASTTEEVALTCLCGARRNIISGLLPAAGGRAKTYIIEPAGVVTRPEETTVYATLDSPHQVVTFSTTSGWSTPLPIVPRLVKLWALPAGCEVAPEPGPTGSTPRPRR